MDAGGAVSLFVLLIDTILTLLFTSSRHAVVLQTEELSRTPEMDRSGAILLWDRPHAH